MFIIIYDFLMAVLMFLFGIYFYKSKGKAARFLSGYNMKSEEERKKYDENAMCKAYGKRMMVMSLPFIVGIIIDIQYQGTGCLIAWMIWLIMFMILSILVYTFFSRMFDLMLPPVAKHSIVVA